MNDDLHARGTITVNTTRVTIQYKGALGSQDGTRILNIDSGFVVVMMLVVLVVVVLMMLMHGDDDDDNITSNSSNNKCCC